MTADRVKSAEDFRSLSERILRCGLHERPRADFLRESERILIEFSGCAAVEIHLREGNTCFQCEAFSDNPADYRYRSEPWRAKIDRLRSPGDGGISGLERFCLQMLDRAAGAQWLQSTPNGSLWIEDPRAFFPYSDSSYIRDRAALLALIPLEVGNDRIGILVLKFGDAFRPARSELELYEGVAQTLAISLAHRRANALLRERFKELTCLYGIAHIAGRTDLPMSEMLERIVELLPPAWLYAHAASACLTFDGVRFESREFREGPQRQTAELVVHGRPRGHVEVVYAEEMPERDEGPFLAEERRLIDTIAHEVALIIARRLSEEEKIRLQEQLRHADRLATIGKLAAGIAHELNEPLGNILGFAQLALKSGDLPGSARKDLEKISSASLYAREVIRKLMLFARQMPSARVPTNLNRLIEEGLGLLENRLGRAGIALVRRLDPRLPEIPADPAQMTQVLVNLAVNAIQAMPGGGRLSVETRLDGDSVLILVSDTGVGMAQDVLSRIFDPFFTTKDVDEGTGLGLSVTHGIITAHGGSIDCTSATGRGTSFRISLPVAPAAGSSARQATKAGSGATPVFATEGDPPA